MAQQGNRVPQKIADFFFYIENTTDYLMTTPLGAALVNWERLGLTGTQINTWLAFRATESSLKPKYTDKAESRTSAIGKKVKKLIKDFTAFSRDPLNEISGNVNSTIDDLLVLHIKAKELRDAEPSPIHSTDAPFADMKNKTGAQIRIRARRTEDATRASMLPDYQLEMKYIILPAGATPPSGPNAAGMLSELSSKAIFVFDADMENQTKILYAYFRFRHLHSKQYNGPWTNRMQIVIA
jgi:hypothetical protein